MVEELFLESIKRHNLIRKKDKIILGVSAGPDSVALLHNFLKIKDQYKLRIICAHLDHSLRKESDLESKFIQNLCKKMGVEIIAERKDVGKFSRDSLEQSARNLRFDFFLKCARQKKVKKIALAHHKDDLAETILMRVIRGTGLCGLRGILPKSSFKSLTIIRPLINLRKKDILDWLQKNNISFCLDQSNEDIKFLRNKIRIELLPRLEAINCNVVSRLSDLAVNAGLDYDFIYNFSLAQFDRLKKQESARSLRLDLDKLKELHPAVFNNVIRIAFERIKGDTRRIEQSHLTQVTDLVKNSKILSSLHLPEILVKKEKKAILIQSLIL